MSRREDRKHKTENRRQKIEDRMLDSQYWILDTIKIVNGDWR
ncbi:MAG: hypothetical protein ACETWQ_18940 [Phycisphaerae bacterium]